MAFLDDILEAEKGGLVKVGAVIGCGAFGDVRDITIVNEANHEAALQFSGGHGFVVKGRTEVGGHSMPSLLVMKRCAILSWYLARNKRRKRSAEIPVGQVVAWRTASTHSFWLGTSTRLSVWRCIAMICSRSDWVVTIICYSRVPLTSFLSRVHRGYDS